MVKRILIAFVCVASFSAHAQNGTISPYSFFGIGDFRQNGTVDNQMMGGLMMHGDSIHINLRNPAAYAKLRLTAYTAGISHREFRLKDFTEEQNTSVTNLDYLAIGFPLGKKVGAGFGLMPFSSVGYQLVQNTPGSEVTNLFTGEGGINRVYASLGFEPLKDLSLGATINFNFGTLEYGRLQTVEGVQFGTIDNRESKINGFDFNYSAMYTPKIGEKYTLHAFAGIDTQINLVSENSERIGSFSTSNGEEIEVIDVDLDALNLRNTELKIPTTFTAGLGFGENKKWFLGAEYSFQQMSDFENAFLGIDNVRYQDASSYAIGGYFIPKYNALSGYLNRINYRAGLRYHVTGLVVNEKEINNFGITFGFGLPLGGTVRDPFSNLNLGFELGRRGTTDKNLIEESYFKVNVGLSLNAIWFQKQKIN
ncbi:hypothetical protein [Allomuricauda sp. d1]|uniref:hypothetical protein n=1 Tax=Allomuricauda sp. d1 TaxID=3136725 RepID=UPI0031D42F02